MAKVTGPLMSISASGSIAGAVSYGTRKGKAVAMVKPRPTIRNTAAQRRVRAAVSYAHDMWSRMGHANRVTWRSYYDMDGRYGFEAFSHILQRRWRLKSGAWNKPAGEPDFPFEGCIDWQVFDAPWLLWFLNMSDGGGAYPLADANVAELLPRQYNALDCTFENTWTSRTPAAAPDYSTGFTLSADVITQDDDNFRIILQHSLGDNYVGCCLIQQTDFSQFRFRRGYSGGTHTVDGGTNRVGYPCRVTGIWDTTDMKLYLNGHEVATLPSSYANLSTTDPIYIGCGFQPDPGRYAYWRGAIDNVIIASGPHVSLAKGRP